MTPHTILKNCGKAHPPLVSRSAVEEHATAGPSPRGTARPSDQGTSMWHQRNFPPPITYSQTNTKTLYDSTYEYCETDKKLKL